MSLKFPISLTGKRGGGLPLGEPSNYWDFGDSSYTNSVDPAMNFVSVGGVPVVEAGTAPDGGDCVITSSTASLSKYITGTPQMTLSVWVQFVINAPSYTPFVTWRNSAVNGTYMMLGRATNGTSQIFNMYGSPNHAVTPQSTADGWVHWMLTYDGNLMRAFRNGVADGTKSYTCTSVCTRSRPLRLGRNWGSGHHPCKFAMMGLWTEAPTDDASAQATADYLYNSGAGRRFADL